MLPKELDHEDGELTATQKVKRVRDRRRCSSDTGRRHVRREPRHDRVPRGVLRGLGTGSIYALLALGFVIIYKSTGVISFAQPALMLAGACWSRYLRRRRHRASALARAARGRAGHGAARAGHRADRDPADGRPAGVRRRDHHDRHRHRRPGRGQRRSSASTSARSPTRGGCDASTSLGAADPAAAPGRDGRRSRCIVAALFAFFRYTRYGLAMRAAAFDQEAALAQGVNVGNVFALSWALAGALAAIAGTCSPRRRRRPADLGRRAGRAAGDHPRRPRLAARARWSAGSPSAWSQSLVGSYQRDLAPWLGDNFAVVAPYVADAAGAAGQALRAVRHPGGASGYDHDRASEPRRRAGGCAAGRSSTAPTPRSWRCSTPGRKQVWVGVIVLVVAFVLPFVLDRLAAADCSPSASSSRSARSGSTSSPGYAGQVSLGHAFFLGVGAYTAAAISGDPDGRTIGFGITNILVWLPAAGLVAALAGVLVAPLATRLRGLYLAIVTLGLVFIGEHIFSEWTDADRRRRRRPRGAPCRSCSATTLDSDRRRPHPGPEALPAACSCCWWSSRWRPATWPARGSAGRSPRSATATSPPR